MLGLRRIKARSSGSGGTPYGIYGVVFALLWLSYGYFHQGGGWNQNSRFAQVRALVEDGTYSINRFCVYEIGEVAPERFDLVRRPLPDQIPADFDMPAPNGLDISIYEGRIFPNKPPGVTLLAAPGYALVREVASFFDFPADGWLPFTLGFYLTTVFSIGLLGAASGALFLWTSRRLFPEVSIKSHGLAALTTGLGTLLFPFATMLFDHVAAAFCGIAGFALLLAAEPEQSKPGGLERSTTWSSRHLAAAGLILGLGVVVNYTMVLVIGPLLLFVTARTHQRIRALSWIVLGGLLPAIFLASYHLRAFGDPLVIANTYQHQLFMKGDQFFLGVFSRPEPEALWALLFSPRRGLFFYSPVLLLVPSGLWLMARRRRQLGEALLLVSIVILFLLMNASFVDWHGGNSFGPRYLAPALPFFCLPLALAFAKRPFATGALAVLSVLIHLLGTATDPQIHKDISNPLAEFVLPAILGQPAMLDEADHLGPVARNVVGAYEMQAFTLFPPGSVPARWNAFNLGELLFPHRLSSLLPLLLILTLGVLWILASARDSRPSSDGASGTPKAHASGTRRSA